MKYFALLFSSIILLSSCHLLPPKPPEAGVSFKLASHRAERISDLKYHLDIQVTNDLMEAISAKATLTFKLNGKNQPLWLDFKAENRQLMQVILNTDTLQNASIINEHILLPANLLKPDNSVTISFIAGEGALNRNKTFFYSLFVPDRARTAIPCFDQPDIKGQFAVTMTIPDHWQAVANGAKKAEEKVKNNLKKVDFDYCAPLSTYLWAFSAGEYSYLSTNWKGKTIGLYHMESDTAKIKRNTPVLFDQTIQSLDWLETYTTLSYPFETFNLVAIPAFQFAGMEHPGATYYRSELLFLDETPTKNEELRRANLIAHETAHMWFGDLVTMPWFNEVWLKEVFANYMADKITAPWFTDINYELRFLMAHYPAAYAVDRTAGTHPISQQLNNLTDAGTLYGNIIYHKSPIVMKQLELMAGDEKLQKGIQSYLNNHAYGNASWDQLIEYIDQHTEIDLKVWGKAWVYQAGRPVFSHVPSTEMQGEWVLQQQAEHPGVQGSDWWPQELNIRIDNQAHHLPLYQKQITTKLPLQQPTTLFFGDASSYGLYRYTKEQLSHWISALSNETDPVVRGRISIDLYEAFLDGSIDPLLFLNHLESAINNETEELLISEYCNELKSIFWRFISPETRGEIATYWEAILWSKILTCESPSLKKVFFKTYQSMALSELATIKLHQILLSDSVCTGLLLGERDKIELLAEVCVRKHPLSDSAIAIVQQSITSQPLKERLAFIQPVLSNHTGNWDAFWSQLHLAENRQKEAWVQEALSLLHHPLRQDYSIQYLPQTLELLEEIQRTGDIFFPMGWLSNSIHLYASEDALKVTSTFLERHPDYHSNLKSKLLQSTDLVERAVNVKQQFRK